LKTVGINAIPDTLSAIADALKTTNLQSLLDRAEELEPKGNRHLRPRP
jgi:hypothetical protein